MGELPLYVKLLNFAFVVIYLVSVTLESTRGEILGTLRDLSMTGRALLANFIIVPILGFFLIRLFDLPPEIRLGFFLLALSPGGFFALQFARVSKGNRVLAVALLVLLSVVAVVLTPVLTTVFFPLHTGRMPFTWLVILLLMVIAVPLLAGRALQQLIPEIAPKLGRFLGALSIVLFIMGAVSAGKYKTPAIKVLGMEGIAVIVMLCIGSWIVGWLLGGPELRNRKVFAIATSMRNVGVCLPIVINYFPGTEVIAPILAFSGISIPMNMVFALVTGWALRDPVAPSGTRQ